VFRELIFKAFYGNCTYVYSAHLLMWHDSHAAHFVITLMTVQGAMVILYTIVLRIIEQFSSVAARLYSHYRILLVYLHFLRHKQLLSPFGYTKETRKNRCENDKNDCGLEKISWWAANSKLKIIRYYVHRMLDLCMCNEMAIVQPSGNWAYGVISWSSKALTSLANFRAHDVIINLQKQWIKTFVSVSICNTITSIYIAHYRLSCSWTGLFHQHDCNHSRNDRAIDCWSIHGLQR
jgi:hypothetical protein